MHSCQPLLEVNLSPEFMNLYSPYEGQVFGVCVFVVVVVVVLRVAAAS